MSNSREASPDVSVLPWTTVADATGAAGTSELDLMGQEAAQWRRTRTAGVWQGEARVKDKSLTLLTRKRGT